MDITDIVTTEYVSFDGETTVSKVRGTFEDLSLKAVLIENDDGVDGVVTRRQLAASHHHPDEKVSSLVWPVPRVSPDADIREVAQLMIDGDTRVLPVYEGRQLRGVVNANDLLEAVRPFLATATVRDTYSADLITIDPETTFGEALHVLREHHITHLPVVSGDATVGMLSLHDVTAIATRTIQQSQGGEPASFGVPGGDGASGAYRSHGGFGAREGERERVLDLPVRDVMVAPVRTIRPGATLEVALNEMVDVGASSLVVVSDDDRPIGIITKTDVLAALTWGAEGNRAVQLYGADYLDDITYDEVVAMVDKFDDMDRDMAVLDARVHLHEHDETLRGTPLLLARIRLFTDRGLFIGSGEGYGASHAIHQAREVIARRIRDDKTYAQSKKHPDEAFWEKRFGWWLEP